MINIVPTTAQPPHVPTSVSTSPYSPHSILGKKKTPGTSREVQGKY